MAIAGLPVLAPPSLNNLHRSLSAPPPDIAPLVQGSGACVLDLNARLSNAEASNEGPSSIMSRLLIVHHYFVTPCPPAGQDGEAEPFGRTSPLGHLSGYPKRAKAHCCWGTSAQSSTELELLRSHRASHMQDPGRSPFRATAQFSV